MTQAAAERVFLNAPFDRTYEPLFITLVGTLSFLALEPHCVLEVREQGDGRLLRIYELMRTCGLSVHDMSRTGTPVRFNMPFELGLACGLKLNDPKSYEVVVLDAKPYRMDRLFSDYKGRDALIHNGTVEGMVACLLDAFPTTIPNAAVEFRRATQVLRNMAEVIKGDMKVDSIYRPALFRLLVGAAKEIATKRGFIAP